jgi:hypothetical protein
LAGIEDEGGCARRALPGALAFLAEGFSFFEKKGWRKSQEKGYHDFYGIMAQLCVSGFGKLIAKRGDARPIAARRLFRK